jgi:hypothetical protein
MLRAKESKKKDCLTSKMKASQSSRNFERNSPRYDGVVSQKGATFSITVVRN